MLIAEVLIADFNIEFGMKVVLLCKVKRGSHLSPLLVGFGGKILPAAPAIEFLLPYLRFKIIEVMLFLFFIILRILSVESLSSLTSENQ